VVSQARIIAAMSARHLDDRAAEPALLDRSAVGAYIRRMIAIGPKNRMCRRTSAPAPARDR